MKLGAAARPVNRMSTRVVQLLAVVQAASGRFSRARRRDAAVPQANGCTASAGV